MSSTQSAARPAHPEGADRASRETVSFILPAHNEAESLPILFEELRSAAKALGRACEFVVVDDASDDGTAAWLAEEALREPRLVLVRFSRNRGQSAALAAGIQASRGEILVTLDADLQNPPADAIPLIGALSECDLACGVRERRSDRWAKRAGSRVANAFRRAMLGDRFRDVGCSLKAWRRPVATSLPKFHGFHRFVPLLAEAAGYRVTEVPVRHRPRQHGATHYGNLGRALHGLRDLLGVAWLLRRNISDAEVAAPAVTGPR